MKIVLERYNLIGASYFNYTYLVFTVFARIGRAASVLSLH